jgi:anti-sigma regulatory factor (Ser/Thr protein kinase)
MQMRQTSGTGRSGGPVLIAERWFRAADLPTLRALVASQAVRAGATKEQVEAIVVVANELATNAVTHGGFEGRMRLWRGTEFIVCEVIDSGPGMDEPETVGVRRPNRTAASGRGLWLVRELADGVEIDSGDGGTAVTARLALRPRRATPTGGAHRF